MPVEKPQLRVTIGGVVVPGAIALQVDSPAYFSAGRFQISFAIGAGGIFTAGYFAALGVQVISIEAALNTDYANLITGQIDNIRINLPDNIATLCGRDLSARMIDTEIAETFNNQTSSQIAATIAARHGLSANVTPTSTQVGQYYELDHARNALGLHSRATTEWTLLSQLAHIENFVLAVAATTLSFGPLFKNVPILLTPKTVMSLELDAATTIPTAATVKSWNSRNKMAITQTAGGGSVGSTIIRPNLTAAQTNQMAEAHLSALARHRTIFTAIMPGDVTTMPSSQILLSGTGSLFDNIYSVGMISRSLTASRGFTQTVRAYSLS